MCGTMNEMLMLAHKAANLPGQSCSEQTMLRLAYHLRPSLCSAQAAAALLATLGTGAVGCTDACLTSAVSLRCTDAHCPAEERPFTLQAACGIISWHAGRQYSSRRRSIPGTAEEQIVFEQACGVPHSDEEDIPHSQHGPTSGQEFDRRHGCS